MKVNTTDYIHFVIYKAVVWMIIGLDTDVFATKIVAVLICLSNSQINENVIYVEMFLTEQVMSMIYPVYCLIMLVFKE